MVAFFLGVLIFLLQNPGQAETFINYLNQFLSKGWGYLPDSVTQVTTSALALDTGGGAIQADASSPATWLIVLLVGVVIFTQIGRLALPGSFTLSPLARLLGAGLGGVNGLLILNLIREYLDGRSLPGAEPLAASASITVIGESSFGPAASELSFQAAELPDFTILDSVAPWVIVGIGALVFIGALWNSIGIETNEQNMWRVTRSTPFGYNAPPPPEKKNGNGNG